MGFFRYDSELMMTISRATDYVILNVLCLLCSMPIVTLGAAVTAKYYVSMKLVRGEEPSIIKAYFKSFKDNFKQSTLIWLLSLVLIVFFAYDWYLILVNGKGETATYFKIGLLIMSVIVLMSIVCIFPIIARFHVTMKEAIRSAVLFSFLHFPKMILVILSIILPYYIGSHYMEYFLGIWLFCTGFSLYYVSRMYVKAFAKLEGNNEETEKPKEVDDEETDESDDENQEVEESTENEELQTEEIISEETQEEETDDLSKVKDSVEDTEEKKESHEEDKE